MLTLNVNGTQGAFTLSLPTTLSDITKEYITNVTSHIEVDANYTVVGTVFREKLSTLILASRRNKKNSEIAVIPIFVKAGKNPFTGGEDPTISSRIVRRYAAKSYDRHCIGM